MSYQELIKEAEAELKYSKLENIQGEIEEVFVDIKVLFRELSVRLGAEELPEEVASEIEEVANRTQLAISTWRDLKARYELGETFHCPVHGGVGSRRFSSQDPIDKKPRLDDIPYCSKVRETYNRSTGYYDRDYCDEPILRGEPKDLLIPLESLKSCKGQLEELVARQKRGDLEQ